MMSDVQVLPIAKVDARYKPGCGKYPVRCRIAMSDGTTHWYVKEEILPAPVLKTQLDEFSKICVGYERMEK